MKMEQECSSYLEFLFQEFDMKEYVPIEFDWGEPKGIEIF